MKTFGKWLSGIILALFIIYSVGPRPAKPDFTLHETILPESLTELENNINSSENETIGIKPDNQARIIWADSSKKEKTKISFLYLHGFSASQAEGDPVHKDLARKYNANLYLSRLAEHGIDSGDSTMINLTAGTLEASAEDALSIAEKLGDKVVVIGTSAGGALSLYLASRHPEIKAIVLYSPCVKLFDRTAMILDKPWGLQIARLVSGGPVKKFASDSQDHSNYWQLNYRIEALVALQNLVSNTMKPDVFSKINCPVFLGYYYKNEKQQDNTVSIPAMLKMFDELGTTPDLKQKKAFPEAGAHVIASHIRSKDWQNVESETNKFLSDVVKL
jgi:pimeloyl-ACP methyl ester carboxylesterase